MRCLNSTWRQCKISQFYALISKGSSNTSWNILFRHSRDDAEADEVKLDLRVELGAIEEAKSVWKRLQRRHLAKVLGLPYFNARTAEAEVAGKDVFPLQVSWEGSECKALKMIILEEEPNYLRSKGVQSR